MQCCRQTRQVQRAEEIFTFGRTHQNAELGGMRLLRVFSPDLAIMLPKEAPLSEIAHSPKKRRTTRARTRVLDLAVIMCSCLPPGVPAARSSTLRGNSLGHPAHDYVRYLRRHSILTGAIDYTPEYTIDKMTSPLQDQHAGY